jgi:hypothetical protein
MAFKDFKFIRKLGAIATQDFGRDDDLVGVTVVALHPKDNGHYRTGLAITRFGKDGKDHELATLEFDGLHALALAKLIEKGGDWGIQSMSDWGPPVGDQSDLPAALEAEHKTLWEKEREYQEQLQALNNTYGGD